MSFKKMCSADKANLIYASVQPMTNICSIPFRV